MIFSLLSFPVDVIADMNDNSDERARFARMDGFWSTRKNDTLLSIAESFFPSQEQERVNLMRELMKLNQLNAAPSDPLTPNRRLELPGYITKPSSPTPPSAGSPGANPFRRPRDNAPAAAPAPPAYRDQLINANLDETGILDETTANESEGRQSIAVRFDTLFQRLNPDGFSADEGMAVSGQFETLDYGNVRIDAVGRRDGNPASGAARAGTLLTVFHDGLAISDRLRADSILGVIRTPSNYFVGSGSRFGLPPLIFEGIQTILSSPEQEIHFSHGRLGHMEGNATQTFQESSGDLTSFGLNHGFAKNWKAGAQWLAVHGSDQNASGSSAAGAIEFAQPPEVRDGLTRLKLQMMSGTTGGHGLWGDGEYIAGRLAHRFGAYRFDPGLRWGNVVLINDLQGAYWRVDARQGPHAHTLGMEVSETNLRRVPLQGGTTSHTLFGSASRRMSRMLTIGSAMELRHEDAVTDPAHSANAFKLSAFGSVISDWGTSRFDIYAIGRKQNSLPCIDRTTGGGWSHDWYQLSGMALNSSVSLTQQDEHGKLTRVAMAGITGRKGISERVSGDTNLVWLRNITPAGTTSEGSVTTNLLFQITADWNLSTGLVMRRTLSGANSGMCDIRAMVTLSYEKSSGIPYSRIYGSRSGTGSILGVTFYDENNDGVQQPTEKGAANVTVYLDGRLAATTDASGKFVFSVIPAGEHTLSLRPEALPLPWSAEPASLSIKIPVRGTANIAIPLTRLPG